MTNVRLSISVLWTVGFILIGAQARAQAPAPVDPMEFMDSLLRDATAKSATRQEKERREAERRLQLQQIERAEQQRWHVEDMAALGRDPGTRPGSGSQQAQQNRMQRVAEVQAALQRYCPNGEPPCSPEPPRYVLEQAVALGLIERVRSAEPTTQCFGVADPEGPVTMECYQRR